MIWLILIGLLLLPSLADAKTMYVRTTTACPNNGDGTAYTCAASAGAAGAYSNLGGVAWGAGANQVSNGDTLYICGFHAEGNDVTRADNNLTPTTSVTIDGACPSDPGSILSANHVLTSGWTGPDEFGAYTISEGGSSSQHMAQLVDGVPVYLPDQKSAPPDASWIDGSFYDDDAGTKYVRPLGGVSANATTIYTTWTGIFTITNVTVTIQNLTLYGLSLDRCIALTNADNSVITNNTIQWCAFTAISLETASDGVSITHNTISQSGNGIYLISVDDAHNSDRVTISDNTITNLDQSRRYASYTSDNTALAIQGGDNGVYIDNTISHLAGSCITPYSAGGQSHINNLIARNQCSDVHDTSGLSPLNQYGIEDGNTNTGHSGDDDAGNVTVGNLVTDVTGACFYMKASQPSSGAAWIVANNTAVNCGTGLTIEDFADGDIGFVFKNNIIYNATVNIDHIQNGTDTLTGIIINNNIYSTDSATSFEWNGTKSAFSAWKTNSSQDAASVQGDPLFVGSADYRPQAASDGRAAGNCWFSTIAAKDVRGRPFLCPPDLGAYQASSGDQALARTAR